MPSIVSSPDILVFLPKDNPGAPPSLCLLCLLTAARAFLFANLTCYSLTPRFHLGLDQQLDSIIHFLLIPTDKNQMVLNSKSESEHCIRPSDNGALRPQVKFHDVNSCFSMRRFSLASNFDTNSGEQKHKASVKDKDLKTEKCVSE